MLRFSTSLVRTLRDDPADAEVPSHRLLVRAGCVRRVAPGIFSWLPFGLLVLRNVERIVREEMLAIGAQEVVLPALLPREPYEATGRWTEYGENLFRLQDRRGGDHLLGPTHEEMFTLVVKDLCSSYRDLPLSLFQIQAKFRDEARPRGGILRGREFVMKDSYSFDVDDEGLVVSYDLHRKAYLRIFERLGIEHEVVSAVSGAMGGSRSEEFLAPCAVGEDTFVRTEHGYAANVEAVLTPAPAPVASDGVPAAHVEDTPDTPTIETLVALANDRADLRRADRPWTAADTLKNVVFRVTRPDGSAEALAVGLPGDREVDLRRLQAAVSPSVAEPFTDADFAAHPGLVKGYIGPGAGGIRHVFDPRVVEGTRWITGANQAGRHVFDLVCGRDFTPAGTIEAAEVREGDAGPDGGTLTLARGVEIGHVFQLGRKYAEALGLSVLGADGHPVTPTMGSYGIGVTRAVAVIAEQHHDERGLCWPPSVAPADVHVLAAGKGDQAAGAEEVAAALEADGLRVLLDDRATASVGVKLTDAELLGLPAIVVVGRRWADRVVELVDRRAGTSNDVPAADLSRAVRLVVARPVLDAAHRAARPAAERGGPDRT